MDIPTSHRSLAPLEIELRKTLQEVGDVLAAQKFPVSFFTGDPMSPGCIRWSSPSQCLFIGKYRVQETPTDVLVCAAQALSSLPLAMTQAIEGEIRKLETALENARGILTALRLAWPQKG